MPCSTRPAISRPAVGARPQAADVMVNRTRPTVNTRRRPNASPSRLAVIRTAATARPNPATTHWMAAAPACSPRCGGGVAQVTMKKSSVIMNAAVSTTGSRARCGRSAAVSLACAARVVSVICCSCSAVFLLLSGRSGGRGNLVEEAVHALDPVSGQDRDVEPDHDGLAAGRAEVPAEPRQVVVAVDRPAEPQHQPGELDLNGGDRGVDGRAALGDRDRVGVAAVLGPQAVDRGAPGQRVGLVPGRDVPVDQRLVVGHCGSLLTLRANAWCRSRSYGRSRTTESVALR